MYKIDSFNGGAKKILSKEPNISLDAYLKDCTLGEYVEIGAKNNIQESSLGDFSYTSENCQIIYADIGKFVNIASYVRINPGQHPMHWACQHHMMYRKEMFGFGEDDDSFFDWRREKRCEIGHDVWLGHNVTVMGGVKIGNGSVVGSGSIVTKDVPPYGIVVGNPAKIIRYRFEKKTIEKLEMIAWWDWEKQKIQDALDDLRDIDKFIEKYGG